MRASGVLMHISSLPGKYGIGSFGKEAVEFSKLLKEMGFSFWQTLPFGTIDDYNSPYKSFSAFAGNPLFIDVETLFKKQLITEEELKLLEIENPFVVPYDIIKENRKEIFKKAFKRISSSYVEKIKKFEENNKNWLPDYALYMMIKEKNNGKDWYDWEDEKLKFHDEKALQDFSVRYATDLFFEKFIQYEFYSEWEEIKNKINQNGIRMIGDMPIYLSLESSDVWANRELFNLSKDGSPKLVAGVPPDYFAEDGQLWGNPLYNWKVMKNDNYKWWVERIENALKIFDTVRIDHFRAFSAYWAVPNGAKTAKAGKWVKGPGMSLFKILLKKFDSSKIIAEDLGDIDDGVRTLLAKTKLPGMRVMQFGFIGDDDSIHIPHNYDKNVVAYTGTHDNNTLLGFLWESNEENRKKILEYSNFTGSDWGMGGFESESCRAIIRTLWQSSANLVIVPVQDLCGFGEDTKMNSPGNPNGNWSFRITWDALNRIDRGYFKKINEIYRR